MGKPKYTGDKLWRLMNLPYAEFRQFYPDVKRNTYKGKRRFWRIKIEEGAVEMPPRPEEQENNQAEVMAEIHYEQEQDTPEPQIVKEEIITGADGNQYIVSVIKGWYEVVTKNGDGVAEIHRLQKFSTKTRPLPESVRRPEDIFTPAAPAEIRPTRRKRAREIGKLLLVFGDSQIGYRRVYDQDGNDELIPTHDEQALSILAQINADLMPEKVINLSDTWDAAELSRFDSDSDNFHRTISPSLQRVHDLYAQLRADNPQARLIEVDSNHNIRIHKQILKKMPELYGMTLPNEEYPLLSYYRLANLGHLAVEYISGYGAAEHVHGEEYEEAPIVFKHGVHASGTPGATIRKEMAQNPTVHVVRGHGHSYEAMAQTTREGKQLYYIQLGTTCSNKGHVPSYGSSVDDFGHPVHHQENWQSQVLIIRDYENGQYQFDVVDIQNGVAFYNGKKYAA